MFTIGSIAIIKVICAFFVVCGFRQVELCFLKKRAIVLDSPGVWVRAADVSLVYAFDNCGERASTMNLWGSNRIPGLTLCIYGYGSKPHIPPKTAIVAEKDIWHAVVKAWERQTWTGPDPYGLFPIGRICLEYLAVVGESRRDGHKIAVEIQFIPWAEWLAIGSNTVRVGFLYFKYPLRLALAQKTADISTSSLHRYLPIGRIMSQPTY